MIGHHTSYLGHQVQHVHVWWPRSESFDNVAVCEGVTLRDFIVILQCALNLLLMSSVKVPLKSTE